MYINTKRFTTPYYLLNIVNELKRAICESRAKEKRQEADNWNSRGATATSVAIIDVAAVSVTVHAPLLAGTRVKVAAAAPRAADRHHRRHQVSAPRTARRHGLSGRHTYRPGYANPQCTVDSTTDAWPLLAVIKRWWCSPLASKQPAACPLLYSRIFSPERELWSGSAPSAV